MEKILIVEDEEPISELIKMNLALAGYDTCQAMDGQEGLNYINSSTFDLIILDIMLPKIDGYELLPIILGKHIPVILLTAKDKLKDKVKGLNMGADDYIVKPFESLELLARIKSVLRRAKKETKLIKFDSINVFIDERKVIKDNSEVALTLKEFDLLMVLLENVGIVMSRDKLLSIVWGYDFEGDTRTVDMHIQKLRKKLGTDKITTIFKFGYRLDK